MTQSVQQRYAPHNACFGCGPANPKGLRLHSVADPQRGGLQASWQAEAHHEAFPGMLNGGIVGALLDCHSNWTAAMHLLEQGAGPAMAQEGGQESPPPCTVTASYAVQLKRPTPTDGPIFLHAKVVSSTDDRAEVEATLTAGGKVCATCRGLFVAVQPGHPAYHRW